MSNVQQSKECVPSLHSGFELWSVYAAFYVCMYITECINDACFQGFVEYPKFSLRFIQLSLIFDCRTAGPSARLILEEGRRQRNRNSRQ